MTEKEKMLAGELYDCGDAELLTQWHKAKDLVRDYNNADSANLQEKDWSWKCCYKRYSKQYHSIRKSLQGD